MPPPVTFEAFTETAVQPSLPFRVESLTTVGRSVFLGTSDGKIVAYHLTQSEGAWHAQLLQVHSTREQQPVRSLVALPENEVLIAAAAESVTAHLLPLRSPAQHSDSRAEAETHGAEWLAPLGAVTGLKDIVTCSARRHKGAVLLAVLQRCKLTVLLVGPRTGAAGPGGKVALTLVRESPTLPESPRCMTWTSKGVLLGFRKEYFLMHMPVGSGARAAGSPATAAPATMERLYSTGKAAAPFIVSLDPVPEVLVGVNAGAYRALPDGMIVDSGKGSAGGHADGAAVLWEDGGKISVPVSSLSTYSHPFLLSVQERQQAKGPKTVLKVSCPLAATIPSQAVSSETAYVSLHQIINVELRQLSCRNVVDLDRTMPSTTSTAPQGRTDAMVALDTEGVLHVLSMVPLAEQARALTRAGQYGLGRLLCQLCPSEVDAETTDTVRTLCAIASFSQGNYASGIQQLREAGANPLLVVNLFLEALSSTSAPSITVLYKPPEEVQPLVAASWQRLRTDERGLQEQALPELINYLLVKRVTLREDAVLAASSEKRTTGPQSVSAVHLLTAIDGALMKAFTLVGRDDAVQDLLYDANWCAEEECSAFLQSHKQWVNLCCVWQVNNQHARALQLLSDLVHTGASTAPKKTAPLPMPKVLLDALDALASSGFAVEDTLTPQSKLSAQLLAVAPCLRDPPLTQGVAVLTLIAYLRGMSVTDSKHRTLIEEYLRCLFAVVPNTRLCLAAFSAASRHHFPECLRILKSCFSGPALQQPSAARTTDSKFDKAPSIGDAPLPSKGMELAAIADFQAAVLADGALVRTQPSQHAENPTGGLSALDATELHAGYWQNLALLVFGGVQGDSTPVEDRRRQLDSFLLQSPYIDCNAAAEFFEDDEIRSASYPERAIVYRRLHNHTKVIDMLLVERGSLDEAKDYCSTVKEETGSDDAYLTLFGRLSRVEDGQEGPQGVERALEALKSCEGVNALSVLPTLPDELPVRQVRSVLIGSLRETCAMARFRSVRAAVLQAQEQELRCLLAREQSKGFVVADDGTFACAVCEKALLCNAAFLCLPNGTVAHPSCVEDNHVCPVTGVDFRQGILPAFLRNT